MKCSLPALTLGAVLVAACASHAVDTSKVSYETRSELIQAEYDNKAADQKNVNTVAAYDELHAAQSAAESGDNDTALKHAYAADAAALQAIKKAK